MTSYSIKPIVALYLVCGHTVYRPLRRAPTTAARCPACGRVAEVREADREDTS